jgi:type II secretory pathway pseudopilin PulG
MMSAEGRIDAAFGRGTTRIARRLRQQGGFTLIEVLLAGVMLAIISAPIGAILSQGAVIARIARERTGADQLAQTQIESLRSIPYTQVGIVNGNPSGSLAASTSTTLPSGEAVTVSWQITWVNDKVPENPYQTNADYKKVVLTIKRNSDNQLLTQKTTFVAAASAPPSAGTTWVQIKRTLQDVVTLSPLVGASVNVTGGPKSVNRTDTTDASGTVLFPALDSVIAGTPAYTVTPTFSGYSVFPDDMAPVVQTTVPSTPGLNSIATIRMYKGTSLTVNVQTSAGAAFTGGATVSLDSSRCGVQTQTIPSGQSSVTFTQCNPWGTTLVPLPPNVSGLTPADSTYYVTAWSTSGTTGNWSTGTAIAVPSSYPTTLTQSVNVKFVSTTFTTTNSQQKSVKVTVTKGGVADTNARVELTGSPTGISPGIALFGTTNGSGQVTFASVPVITGVGTTTFTISANDQGVAKGTATVALNSSTTSPASVTVAIS